MTTKHDDLYPWQTERRYNAYSLWLRQQFGCRVQTLPINAGFACPNRDGHKGTTGCTFCANEAFSPAYSHGRDAITQQIDNAIAFFSSRRRPQETLYLAYFQSYSNTYADIDTLRARYREALQHPQVKGLVVATRPDCVDDAKLDLLAELAQQHYIAIEYGIESCYDSTLADINRGHTFADIETALQATARRGLPIAAHLILGLPGETRDMMLQQTRLLNALPIDALKLHQLQLLKGSTLGDAYLRGETRDYGTAFSLEEYLTLVCDIIERLRPTIALERMAGEVPPRYQAAPERGWLRPNGKHLKSEEFVALVTNELRRRDTYQGCRYREQLT